MGDDDLDNEENLMFDLSNQKENFKKRILEDDFYDPL